jgi:hypothetical protein
MPRRETLKYAGSNERLRSITPLLSKWCDLVDHYSETTGDACYWYNERANISILASAAWQQGWVALEEYSTRKFRGFDPEEQEKPPHGSGRCDLYFESKAARIGYACEAKQAWQPIGNARIEDELRVVRQKRASSWADTGRLTKFEADHRLALTFCVPMLAFRQVQGTLTPDSAQEQIRSWCKQLARLRGVDSIAYVFPRATRMLSNEKKLRAFPGVALLVRHRSRRKAG